MPALDGTRRVGGRRQSSRDEVIRWIGAGAMAAGAMACSVAADDADSLLVLPLPLAPDVDAERIFAQDLDADGVAEIVAVQPDAIEVLRADGRGGYASASRTSIDARVTSMAFGDLNADGVVDIAFTSGRPGTNPGSIEVLRGEGELRFSPWAARRPGSQPIAIQAADINSDGAVDLVYLDVVHQDVRALLNEGPRGFSRPSPIVGGLALGAVVARDLNGDGHVDVVAGDRVAEKVLVWFSRGNGGFGPVRAVGDWFGGDLLAEDVDGDGTIDLLAGDDWWRGTGTDRFEDPISLGLDAMQLRVADVDGDGGSEVIGGRPRGEIAVVSVGGLADDTNGVTTTTPSVVRVSAATRTSPEFILLDVDGDGLQDIVGSAFDRAGLAVVRGWPGLMFAGAQVAIGVDEARRAVARDLDGDGHVDIVVATRGAGGPTFVRGRGNGMFDPGTPIDAGAGADASDVAVGDLNGDGRPDVIALDFEAERVSVHLADDAGGFQPADRVAIPGLPIAVTVGDLDGDGHADLAVATRNPRGVQTIIGNGRGGFEVAAGVAVRGRPRAIAVQDLDADGVPEIIVAADGIEILRRVNDGQYTAAALDTVRNAVGLAVRDMDDDGDLDIVTCTPGDGTIVIAMGNGDGGFGTIESIPAGPNPSAFAVGDVNGDGRLDISVIDRRESTLRLLLADPDGRFTIAARVPGADGRGSVTLADVNGDGVVDQIIARPRADRVSVILGRAARGNLD